MLLCFIHDLNFDDDGNYGMFAIEKLFYYKKKKLACCRKGLQKWQIDHIQRKISQVVRTI